MSTDDRRVCLCGESTGSDYAPGHDSLHASELALAVHAGAISETEAVAQIPTVDTVARFEEILASRRSGRYTGGIKTWGAWLDDMERLRELRRLRDEALDTLNFQACLIRIEP